MAEKQKDIGEIRKNGKEDADRIMVKVAEYKGKPYADIRTYYRDDVSGDWKPTKKGVAFHSLDQLDRAIALLTTARDELAARTK